MSPAVTDWSIATVADTSAPGWDLVRRWLREYNRKLHVICLLLAASPAARGLSYSTVEGSFALQVALAAEAYSQEHGGRSPASWPDLEPYFSRPIDEEFRAVTPTKRYAFLPQPLPLPPPHDGDLLLITRRPFREMRLYTNWYGGGSQGLREPGRYIIYRTDSGEFEGSYVEEAYIQQAFNGSGSLLPSPDSEPLRRHERHEIEARRRSLLTWTAGAAFPLLLLARLIYRRSPGKGMAEKT